jgi:hypothetical protein
LANGFARPELAYRHPNLAEVMVTGDQGLFDPLSKGNKWLLKTG